MLFILPIRQLHCNNTYLVQNSFASDVEPVIITNVTVRIWVDEIVFIFQRVLNYTALNP